jgi:amino acid transporter
MKASAATVQKRGILTLSLYLCCKAGEVFTLPVVVLISLMAQPRLQLAMAQDGLLPPIFSKVDETGNLRWGTFLSGVAMIVVATFVPFAYLDDLISVGILLAFSMTNSCLILLRCESPVQRPRLIEKHLLAYNALCLVTGLLCSHAWHASLGPVLSALAAIATVCVAVSLAMQCPQGLAFGGSVLNSADNCSSYGSAALDALANEPLSGDPHFRTPFVPYLPCCGIFINWYLVSQLEVSGLLLLFVYIGATLTAYFCFCSDGSFGNSLGWKRGSYQSLAGHEQEDGFPAMKREYSLPPIHASKINGKSSHSSPQGEEPDVSSGTLT